MPKTTEKKLTYFPEIPPQGILDTSRIDGKDILPGSIVDEKLVGVADNANLIADKFSSFEYFDNDDTVGTVAVAADGDATCTTDECYAQSRCLKVVTRDSDGALDLNLADASGEFSGYYVPVLVSTRYYISCWAKTTNTASFRFVVYGDDATTYLASAKVMEIKSEWTRYFLEFTTGAATTAVTIHIVITSSSS